MAGMLSLVGHHNMCLTKFQFLIAFVVAKQCLRYIKGLTVSLQKRAKDICQAYNEVNSIVTALTEVRQTLTSNTGSGLI